MGTMNFGAPANTAALLAALALESGGNLERLVTRLGEVQANPTANTVLERLKAIATALASVAVTGPLTDAQLRATAVPAIPNAATSGGATPYHYIAAGSAAQDSIVVKASPGQIYSIAGMNAVATARYLKLYNKATSPTSADTPVHVLMLPANGTTGAGFTFALPVGLKFTAGISFRLTTGIADNDAGACSASDCVINLGWI